MDTLLPLIKKALAYQDKLLALDSGYLMKKDWDAALAESREFYEQITAIPDKVINRHPQAHVIRRFCENHRNPNIRTQRNEQYKAKELAESKAIFDDIDGKSLDDQQRDAIVTDEYNNLIIAGAGSGKTLTIVGKIKYLVEHKGVSPEDILATSFTRKSVEELRERIKKAGMGNVQCRTFHSIGLSQLPDMGVANENELKKCVLAYLQTGIKSSASQMSAFLEFYGCFRHIPKEYQAYRSDGERFESLKAMDLRTIKGLLETRELDTIQGERVKSLEELAIANFLFLHGIEYEYEKNYTGSYESEANKRLYQPDFYLPEYDIWLEHFGINENGRAPQYSLIEEQQYLESMEWKRSIHAKNNTRLIESYSYWNKNDELWDKLEQLLANNGVVVEQDEERMSELYTRLNSDDRFLKGITNLISTFLSLAKANNVSMAEVIERARVEYAKNSYLLHRFRLFISFTAPIMEAYTQLLRDKKQIDFDDMINTAAAKISERGINERFKYIIVDEYQDISKSRFGLIKAIREQCDAKLICVGDDWQAIYRFAGSDVSLFTNFEQHVGYHETLKIECTYRNSQELVDIASAFIEKNNSQIPKTMHSDKHENLPVVIYLKQDMAEAFESALHRILANRKNYDGRVLVLGRHNFDIVSLYPGLEGNEHISFRENRKTGDVRIIFDGYDDITYMSVHRAKGLEASDVIVLNLVNDMYGFPNRLEDDPILQLLLDDKENYEFAEERRLFYVALTRTKNQVYLISRDTESGPGPSPFVEELKQNDKGYVGLVSTNDARNPTLCPRCKTGRLVVRKNTETGKSFLGCTNYPFCEKSYDQTEILEDKLKCPVCGGWMVRRRRGADGMPFFGCSNYPRCAESYDATEDFRPIPKGTKAWAAVRIDERSRPHKQGNHSGNNKYGKKKQARSGAAGPACPKCGGTLEVRRNGKDGSKFYGCSNYPRCKYTRNLSNDRKSYAYIDTSSMQCPKCGGTLKLRRNGQTGKNFYGCSNYPKCKYTKDA